MHVIWGVTVSVLYVVYFVFLLLLLLIPARTQTKRVHRTQGLRWTVRGADAALLVGSREQESGSYVAEDVLAFLSVRVSLRMRV